MLSWMVQNVYIDKEQVEKEYLRWCKAGIWKKEKMEEALKCWNLERILDTELACKQKGGEWTLEDMVNERNLNPTSCGEVVVVD